MSLAVITVNNQSPALDHRASEVAVVAGGAQSSGSIVDTGGVTIGSWTYTAQASS